MKKLTAEVARRDISHLKAFQKQPNIGLSLREETYLQALEIALPILEQQERGEGEWIEWGGGECPNSKRVDVLFRDGEVLKNFNPANLRWDLVLGSADIIAYRIISENSDEN